MTRATKRRGSPAPQAQRSAWYVYGIIPSYAEAAGQAGGIGDPPAAISLVREGDVAAIVSEVELGRPLGTPEDLVAHQRLLDDVAAEMPVLPMRFGAVLSSRDAVATELLSEHRDQFAATLAGLDGMAEYIVRGRYDQRALLASVLASHGEAASLARQIRGTDEYQTRNQRITFGEIVTVAIEEQRQADTTQAAAVLERLGTALVVRDPTHEEDAVHLAVLARLDRQAELERAVHELASDWHDRVTLRLLGPLAPYDFVGEYAPPLPDLVTEQDP